MNNSKSETAPTISQVANRQRFKTYDGHCYVLKDKIVITHNRKIKLDQALDISRWFYMKIGIFIISTTFSMSFSYIEFLNDKLYLSATYLFFGVSFGILSKNEFNKFQILVIDRSQIISVNFYGSRFGRKHSFFEVVYSKNTILKHSEIFLPKPKNTGRPNTQKALELMDELIEQK